MTPGIYTIPAADYHADCAPEPSLSNSILRILLSKSPAHARLAHPRLNPDYKPYEAEKFDLGTAAHAYLLEGEDRVSVIDASDWRTKEAKAQRDLARLKFKVPMLAHQYEEMLQMVQAAKLYIGRTPLLSAAFSAGKPEQTVIWKERIPGDPPGGIWCRAMIDWLTSDRSLIVDYKTTSAENPEAFMRGMVGYGYDTQEVFYRRALMHHGYTAEFVFLVQEDSPPFSCYIVRSKESMRVLGESKVKRGMDRWSLCTRLDMWPEYSEAIYEADAPAWALMQEEAAL